ELRLLFQFREQRLDLIDADLRIAENLGHSLHHAVARADFTIEDFQPVRQETLRRNIRPGGGAAMHRTVERPPERGSMTHASHSGQLPLLRNDPPAMAGLHSSCWIYRPLSIHCPISLEPSMSAETIDIPTLSPALSNGHTAVITGG